ncbi:MAG TPA: CHRD domain-containing protein, partial [Thermoanaerobaculia bacterium]|nr:CHRD domain-containing protein [Thermoanaerobaculia bacterium]
PGDPNGFGHSTVVFDPDLTEMTVTTSVGGLGSMVTAAHIHTGVAGEPGPVLIGFADSSRPFMNGVPVTVTGIDPADAAAILANPAGYYVNVHTTQFPAGAVRGQLTSAGGVLRGNALSGEAEYPGPGDEDGGGAFILTLDDSLTQLTYDVVVTDIGTDFTGAHIHEAPEGVDGPVIVALMTSSAPFVDGRMQGSAAIPAELGARFVETPELFYVNVHTSAFPAGAVRGQLAAVNEVDLPVIGRVVGAGGELFVTDARVFNPSYAEEATVLLEFFPTAAPSLSASAAFTFTVAPRGTMVLDDVAGMGFLNASGLGSVRLTSSQAIRASSRIFDDQRASGEGTIGQFFPGLTRESALRRGVITQLVATSAAAEKGSFRTNLGFFNPNAGDVTVQMELRGVDGSLMATETITLGPMEHRQRALIGQWFDLPVMERPDMTLTFSASSPIFGYASVLDNTTSDPVAVIAQEDTGEPVL